jgi:hypothetical protein
MRLPIQLIVLSGCSTLACPQEGRCRELSGRVQVCASSYWQDVNMDGYSCEGGVFLPNAIPYLSSSASVIVGPPVQTTRQIGNDHASAHVGVSLQGSALSNVNPTSLLVDTSLQATVPAIDASASSTSAPQEKPVTGNGDVGFWYCNEKKPPTRNERAFTASYTLGGTMASVYYPSPPLFRCDIQPPTSNYFVAVWTRYVPTQGSQPQPQNCNEWLALENPKNGRTATALVIDRCASCVGVGHQMSDPYVSDSVVNGATIDLSPDLFHYLYENSPDGVYDITYNGSIYGGSWDGDPDELKTPYCGVPKDPSQAVG